MTELAGDSCGTDSKHNRSPPLAIGFQYRAQNVDWISTRLHYVNILSNTWRMFGSIINQHD
ncbi:hypothetical protein DERP_011393 [Dermatophagoides pteronyssinus]|uniref:Uncharacterized protein n=1 Tax=Dermatophagoides pteronyssinus TaxID=6956 RepID=A0ABQ8J522_DERPT|nr:hypothetical protein DERP_011393 [Dermatophagoides pteronyssinus]